MDQREKMKADLIKDIDGYLRQLVYVKDLVAVSRDLEENERNLRCAPNFTLITKCALADSYMLVLMRLYDKASKAKTIPNLIQKCKKNLNLFPSADDTLRQLEEFEKEMKEDAYISEAIKELSTRRDTSHAHNDKRYFGEKLQNEKSALKEYHISFLISFSEKVLTYLFNKLSTDRIREARYDKDLERIFKIQ